MSRTSRVVHSTIEPLEPRRLLSAVPELGNVGTQTLPIGKPIQIPLIGFDADGQALSYSASKTGAGVSVVLRPQTNTWMEMNVVGFGTMTFQLFDDVAPETVSRISGLAQSGFYDGLTFHRVVENFVIQGGDPAGDGSGGPQFRFDDEFDPNVLFTGKYQLAMANSGKDTNGSQFFITLDSTRFLDFNHTIFGQLVRGQAVADAIAQVAVNAQSRPLTPVVISSVNLVQNITDAVLQVRTTNATGGTVSVTVTDPDGNAATRTFRVRGVADSHNAPPILTNIPENVVLPTGNSVSFTLSSFDIEGDLVEYAAQFDEQNGASGQINDNVVTVTRAPGYVGPVSLFVGVKAAGANSRGSSSFNENQPLGGIYDTQRIQIAFGDRNAVQLTPQVVQTVAGGTVGTAFEADNVLLTFRDNDTRGRGSDWRSTRVDWGDGTVSAVGQGDAAVAVVRGDDGLMRVLGDRRYARPGSYVARVNVASPLGVSRTVEVPILVRPLATLESNILTVNGTTGNDIVGISSRNGVIRANVNGTIRSFPASAVGRVEIYLHDGHNDASVGAGIPGTYMLGGPGNDTLRGGDGDDTLTGAAGNDVIFGGNGNDRLNGGPGRDRIFGEGGDDRIYGGPGNDTLDGGGGVDRIWGVAGNNLIFGGASNDRLFAGTGNDTLYGQAGNDTFDLSAGGNNTVFTGTGRNTVLGGPGDDTIFARNGFIDSINGGGGFNRAQVDPDDELTLIQQLLD